LGDLEMMDLECNDSFDYDRILENQSKKDGMLMPIKKVKYRRNVENKEDIK